jgi:hypothetical protein
MRLSSAYDSEHVASGLASEVGLRRNTALLSKEAGPKFFPVVTGKEIEER